MLYKKWKNLEFLLPREHDLSTFEEVLGVVDSYCLKIFLPLLSKEDVILDLGAHIGFFSLAVAPYVKSVISIEPEEENYRYLCKNIEKNNLSNIQTIPKALAKEEGTKTFYKSQITPARHSLCLHPFLNGEGYLSQKVQVPTLSLPSVLEQIQTCKILKSDIEGAEYEVFLNCPVPVLKKIKIFLLEYHNLSEEKHKNVLVNFFQKLNFEVVFGKETTYKGKLSGGSLLVLNPEL